MCKEASARVTEGDDTLSQISRDTDCVGGSGNSPGDMGLFPEWVHRLNAIQIKMPTAFL